MADKVERRLAAILSADVVGYARLMQADEAGTLARLKNLRKEVVESKITEHGGRLVKLMGDGALVEFPSVVDAVQSAVEIQDAMRSSNADTPEDQHVEFRIGINVGDIIVDGDDIYGDGVNIAARIEALCPAGGVCLSGKAHEEVHGKVGLAFEDMGEQSLKNIAKPVRVYALTDSGDKVSEASPALPLPSKPSIAVLPFTNMSGDPEQDYFSDGIADDIITGLSRFRDLFVISRNSSFRFRGDAVNIKDVGRELGVRYVLEGGVRKAGSRVRITAQLIEAETDRHLWAEKYDGDLADIFDLQDEITANVVGAIQPGIFAAEIERAIRKRADNLDAHDLLLRGWSAFFQLTKEGLSNAQIEAQTALEVDPGYAHANTLLAWANYMEFLFGWSDDPGRSLEQAQKAAEAAISCDGGDASPYPVLAVCRVFKRQFGQAQVDADSAIALNPNLAHGYWMRACVNAFVGEGEKGLEDIRMAMRLSPRDPFRFGFLNILVICHLALRNHEAAVQAASELITLRPDYVFGHANMALCCGHLGRTEQAKHAIGECRRLNPSFDRAFVEAAWPWQNAEDLEHTIDGLRNAGWDG
jgi:adenylate cyclase